MSWYKIGTIAATNGSKIITGTGTQFTNSLNGVSAGRMLLLPAAGTVQVYEIESVQSDTQLTLVSAYTGATGTGKAYAIPTSPAVSIEQFAHEFASTLAYYQQQLSGWQQILTGTGNVTLTTPDGQTVTVRSQKAWDDALNGKVTGVKQTGPFDATAGSLALNTAWGWGGVGQTLNFVDDAEFLTWARTLANGSRIFRDNANAAQYTKQYSAGLLMRASDSWATLSIGYGGATAQGIRATGGNNSAGATITYELWTDKNLTFPLSTANGGSGKNSGAFANGPNAGGATTLAAFLSSVETYGNNSAGSASISDDGGTWHTYLSVKHRNGVDDGVNYGFMIVDRSMTSNSYDQIGLRKRTPAGWRGFVNLWHSENLIKQSSLTDTTSGAVMIFGSFGLGAGQTSYTLGNMNDATRNGFASYVANVTGAPTANPGYALLFGYDSNSRGQLASDAGSDELKFRATAGGVWKGWTTLINNTSSQTISGSKTFTSNVAITAQGIEIGSTTTAQAAFCDFHSSGTNNDYDVRLLVTGGASAIGQGILNINAGALRWNGNNLVDAATGQSIGGYKTFIQDVTLSKATPRLVFENTSNTAGEVGRVVDVQYGTNTFDFIRRSASGQSTNQQAIRFSYPSSGTGIYNAVISGINAVADSNGFWKTASPVVKLFADGTSELTSEAEGITTERVSEGVYRISGCLGLNADRAWGGDEGGIDVPMCRNKLPRLWVDYGGDEGSEKINPDGSIVIRTYHRPHPEAPGFARNEIEGYANGDPIDIPHDTFISVRVQMPETEVQATVVETVPDEVTNEVVLDTSAQA